MAIRTELEWSFAPADMFDARRVFPFPEGELVVDGGTAVYALKTACDPVPFELRNRIIEEVEQVFSVRRLITRRAFRLGGPDIVQHQLGGGRSIAVSVTEAVAVASVGHVDIVITDASGQVTFDSKKQRIADESAVILDLAPKALHSPVLRAMLESYGRAVDDPANELVHLYEIRDAASKHYGGEGSARDALEITKKEWQELGRIANEEPIAEGRHRGKQLQGLRPATPQELALAREIARLIVEKFAARV